MPITFVDNFRRNIYNEKGCIVDNILKEDEYLVNLLEFFRKYPDDLVNIDDYVNYCEMQYDYTPILNSTFFKSNKDFGTKLSEQILCSILRRDDNYHYENVSLVFKDGKPIMLAPIIDLEFSQMFMYPDELKTHERKFSAYDEGMQPIFTYDNNKSYEENIRMFLRKINEGSVYDNFNLSKNYLIMRNINTIVSLYPDVAIEFIRKINLMKNEAENLNIDFNSDFLGNFSSSDWEPSRMIFKECKKETDIEYILAKKRAEEKRITLAENKFNERLKKEVIWSIDKLTNTIMFFIDINNHKLPDITKYQNDTLYEKIDRYPEEIMEILFGAIKESDKVKIKE